MRRRCAAAIALTAFLLAAGTCAAQAGPPQTLPVTSDKPKQGNPPQTKPATNDTRLADAQKAADAGDYAKVATLLADYLKDHPENAQVHFQLGYALAKLKRFPESAREYRRATEIDPTSAKAHINLGLALMATGEYAGAAAAFEHAAELMPGQAKPRVLAAEAFKRGDKFPEAIQQYKLAASVDPKNYDIYYDWGMVLMQVGRAAEAEVCLRQAITLKPDSGQAHELLASALVDEQKMDAAVTELKEYLRIQPNDRHARIQLAGVLEDLDKWQDALAEINKADEIAPPDVSSLTSRASILIQQKDWDGAAKALQAAVAKSPSVSALHAELGRILLEKRDFPNAEIELRRALALNPTEPGVLGNLISTVYLAGNYPVALELLDVQEKTVAPTPIMLFVRATCYDKLQRKAEAAATYKKFLDADQGRNDKEEFQARERMNLLLRELSKK